MTIAYYLTIEKKLISERSPWLYVVNINNLDPVSLVNNSFIKVAPIIKVYFGKYSINHKSIYFIQYFSVHIPWWLLFPCRFYCAGNSCIAAINLRLYLPCILAQEPLFRGHNATNLHLTLQKPNVIVQVFKTTGIQISRLFSQFNI